MTEPFVEAMVAAAARAAASKQYREGWEDGCETTLLLLLGEPDHGGTPCPYELSPFVKQWAAGALARVQNGKEEAGR